MKRVYEVKIRFITWGIKGRKKVTSPPDRANSPLLSEKENVITESRVVCVDMVLQ